MRTSRSSAESRGPGALGRILLAALTLAGGVERPCEAQAPSALQTGFKVGEVSASSATIWTRRTDPDLLDPSPPEAPLASAGELRVRWWSLESTGAAQETAWVAVTPATDGIHQFVIEGLEAETRYGLEVQTRSDPDGEVQALRGSFATAPAPSANATVRFVATTGQRYDTRDAGDEGHELYRSMLALRPDFFVHTGDVVYYDKVPEAKDVAAARARWGVMYSLPLSLRFHLQVPSYFIKDDHDTLKNDCWPGQTYGDLTWDQGVALFREQVPYSELPYRSRRWGRHLEVWILEGREFRSSNRAPDGPDKTILGAEQWRWLEEGLAASDATFRVVLSATPIVGPDRSGKRDNHANQAFAHEGERLRALLASHPGAVVVCGDRHWQYTSQDAETGLREFCTGPTTNRHAGGFSQDRRTDEHRYLAVRGGFLSVDVTAAAGGDAPELIVRHHDPFGRVRNEERVAAPEGR